TILEDMPLMAAAIAAMDFGADHAERIVDIGAKGTGNEGVEARPAGAALKLGGGVEQRLIAARVSENTLPMLIEQRRGKGAFGALFAQDVIGLGREFCPPFGIGQLERKVALGGIGRTGRAQIAQGGERSYGGPAEQHCAAVDNGHVSSLPI